MAQDHAAAAVAAVDGPACAACAAGVTIAYGDHVAVRDVDFDLPTGGVTAIIGPNGSGKTTLLRAMSGLEPVGAGRLLVLGAPAGQRRRDVAHVLQATRVNDAVPLTVREVVTMGRYARRGAFGWLRAPDRAAVARALDRMGIADLAGRHLRELSGGQRQRVHVAQGLAQEAPMLLLDEPVTGLDLTSQERIETVIREETAAGRTVVLTTHDVDTAAQADYVLLLATHVVSAGAPSEVLSEQHLGHAYGGRTFRTEDGTIVLGDPHHHGPMPEHGPH